LRKEAADAAAQKAQDTRDLVTERLGKKLQLAQILGAKDPILAAFNSNAPTRCSKSSPCLGPECSSACEESR
jgi:hypothetical protein